jgi:DNA mismatch repair protein MutL
MTIRVLPENLINKIAAGEVVEDPLSVVKELVENSIDAGCSTIEIELIGGGHRLIRVSDDGCGMSQDDAVLCFERHATSKIRTQEDLLELSTMGFRGEALASIAAIGKVELKTARKGKAGTFVEIQGGKLLRVLPLERSHGTTIEVRELFFSTPARRKFQKSSEASSAKIEKWLCSFSLGYPGINFSLREGSKYLDFQDRLEMVFGKPFSSNHHPIDACKEGISVKGLLGGWVLHRPQRSGQVIFVNGRIVDAPQLSFAVKEAYATRLPQGRHPLFFLHVELPANLVDVNVHPQKREIRFCEENKVKEILRQTVSEIFDQKIELSKPIYVSFETADPIPWVLAEEETEKKYQEPLLPLQYKTPQILTLLWHYILLDSLEVVDLRRAVERILFEKCEFKHRIGSEPLLIPIRLEVSRFEASELRKRRDQYEAMGFGFAEIGERLFCIERIPEGWEASEVTSALIESLSEEKEENYPKVFRRCIKKRFTLSEAESIYKSLLACKIKEVSPSGDPIIAKLEESDIAACMNKESKRS